MNKELKNPTDTVKHFISDVQLRKSEAVNANESLNAGKA